MFLLPSSSALAQADVTTPVRTFIDSFNRGDMKAAYATFASGTLIVVDEFAPYQWVSPYAPQDWAAEYDRHAQETGVTDGRVTYGKATRIEIKGAEAYVILTTYVSLQGARQAPAGRGPGHGRAAPRSRRMKAARLDLDRCQTAPRKVEPAIRETLIVDT